MISLRYTHHQSPRPLDVYVYKPVTIGDKVWQCSNGNGIQDVGEAGKPNIEVTLFNLANDTVATVITNATGKYQFANLPPGTYVVKFLLPTSFEISLDFEVQFSSGQNVTVFNAVLNHIVLDNSGSHREGIIPPQTLESGRIINSFDAGIFRPQNAGNNDLKDSDVDPVTGRAALSVVSGIDVYDVTTGITALPSISPNKVFEDHAGKQFERK